MALITLAQQNSFKLLDNNWAVKRIVSGIDRTQFDELVENVESVDLSSFLGFPLLQDLQDNPTDPNNIILLDGGSYTNCAGHNVKFRGIRYILAHLNHYRYVDQISTTPTSTGYVQKKSDQSNPASQGAKGEIKYFSKKLADVEMNKIIAFLNENSETYTLWSSTKSKKPHSYKLRAIKRY